MLSTIRLYWYWVFNPTCDHSLHYTEKHYKRLLKRIGYDLSIIGSMIILNSVPRDRPLFFSVDKHMTYKRYYERVILHEELKNALEARRKFYLQLNTKKYA